MMLSQPFYGVDRQNLHKHQLWEETSFPCLICLTASTKNLLRCSFLPSSTLIRSAKTIMASLNLDILPLTSSSLVNIALIDLSNLVMSLLAGTVSAPAFLWRQKAHRLSAPISQLCHRWLPIVLLSCSILILSL